MHHVRITPDICGCNETKMHINKCPHSVNHALNSTVVDLKRSYVRITCVCKVNVSKLIIYYLYKNYTEYFPPIAYLETTK